METEQKSAQSTLGSCILGNAHIQRRLKITRQAAWSSNDFTQEIPRGRGMTAEMTCLGSQMTAILPFRREFSEEFEVVFDQQVMRCDD